MAHVLISSQFPNLAPQRIERFGAGMDNIAYLIDGKRVFRFPRRSVVVPFLKTETAVLPLISPRLPLRVPVPYFVGEPQTPYPWMFAGYELLAGTTACSAALSDEDRVRMAPALGKFLGALHRIDPSKALAVGLPGDLIGRMDHARRLPMARERLAELESSGYVSDIEPFLEFMEANAPEQLESCAIVHGDLYARHLVLDDSLTLTGVIDWGDVHFGHPAVDLMVAHAMLPPQAHSAFVEAYGEIDTRTWALAKYRAIYHSALVANYGIRINDSNLAHAGISALRRISATL